MTDPVIIRTFNDRGEAEIARALLEAEGIAAALAADDMGQNTPPLDFSFGVQLVVEGADAERARELLEEQVSDAALDEAERDSEKP
ncbi:MAG TPA: DUF2007 domain-containing protein [Candidatus Polarisedimenticolaceae bacterium]|nr:DUF2007 domain-containing protein [Candidatus Polarisedimenticolaceae bacterium]